MGEHVRVSVNLNALEETLELLAQATRENQRLRAELAAGAERCRPLAEALGLIERSLFAVTTLDEARLVARAAIAAHHASTPGAGRGDDG